jgi:hypothetical protein
MKVNTSKVKVEKILKDQKTKRLNFDMKIQRSEDIWDKKRRSKMMHSIMIKWPTNSIFAAKEGNILSIIDGKQRLTTVLSYIADKFALEKGTPGINGVEVQGKKFSELPDELKSIIMAYEFDFTIIQEATLEMMEELFFRWNSGMPMRQIETTRAILGGKTLKLVEDVSNTPFFQTKANISNKSKKHFVDQELVLQILAMIHKEETGFSGKEIENFVRELRNQRIQDELKSKMQNASFYLNQVFLKKEKMLRKVHIPTLFKLVLDMQEKALVITPSEFEGWCRSFFENMPEPYKKACESKTASKDSVKTRYREMKANFESFLENRNSKNNVDSAS